MSKLLFKIKGIAVKVDEGGRVYFTAGMSIDADGSPRAYGPDNSGLDYTANAGRPGRWWGVETDCDGRPIVQKPSDPAPGMYVSPTSYRRKDFHYNDPRAYLDSEKVPFIAVPLQLIRAVEPVVLGCRCRVTYKSKSAVAIVGDIGPKFHLGEGSMRLAQLLGIANNPRSGGVSDGVKYELYPGQTAAIDGTTYSLQPLTT